MVPIPMETIMPDARLFLDFISGRGRARSFFSHAPDGLEAAFGARSRLSFPRGGLARALSDYNAVIGGGEDAARNIEALSREGAMCVITGQQAGFLGGPAYTLYKIATAIRLAALLAERHGVDVVPVFWLATDDHDQDEIDHAYVLGADGDTESIGFRAPGDGRPVGDLVVDDAVIRGRERFLAALEDLPAAEELAELTVCRPGMRYGEWIASFWARIFAGSGLVVMEPRALSALSGEFFERALAAGEGIASLVRARLSEVEGAGYAVPGISEGAGVLFTIDEHGRRVRIGHPSAHAARAAAEPDRYSADALVRPVLADSLLPTAVSVLGPGELTYQSLCLPIYRLLGVEQPALVPRLSVTVIGRIDERMITRLGLDAGSLLAPGFDPDAVSASILPASTAALFEEAYEGIERVLGPLRDRVAEIDPALVRPHEKTLMHARGGLDRLKRRTVNAVMAGEGIPRNALGMLRSLVRPRGRPQERVLAASYLLARFGRAYIRAVMASGDTLDFSHRLLPLEEDRGTG